jgi:hypothetical protein
MENINVIIHVQLIVLLLKVDTSTKWFMELQNAGAKFLWINGRLKYNTGKPAPFPSMLVVLEKRLPLSKAEGVLNTFI